MLDAVHDLQPLHHAPPESQSRASASTQRAVRGQTTSEPGTGVDAESAGGRACKVGSTLPSECWCRCGSPVSDRTQRPAGPPRTSALGQACPGWYLLRRQCPRPIVCTLLRTAPGWLCNSSLYRSRSGSQQICVSWLLQSISPRTLTEQRRSKQPVQEESGCVWTLLPGRKVQSTV
jgi:hypothetical protein